MTNRNRRLTLAVVGSALAIGLSTATMPAATASDLPLPLDNLEALQTKIEKSITLSSRAEAGTQVAPEDCFTSAFNGVVQTTRIAGADRYNTAICVSLATWANHDDPMAPPEVKAKAVVVARGDLFPDALAGGPLAAHSEGPLLLTTPTSLLDPVQEEIARVLAPGGRIYLLGGTGALSDGIRIELQAAGYDVLRLAGSNRFETAIAVAEHLSTAQILFFATGLNFPDALAAGNAAATISFDAKHFPEEIPPAVVLLTSDTTMPASTAQFVIERANQLGGVIPVTAGGQADAAASAAFGEEFLIDELRFVGVNRFDTARDIAEGIFTDDAGLLVGAGVGLATGLNFPDALAATGNLARFDQPILLTSPTQLSLETAAFLTNHAGERDPFYDRAFLDVFGGTGALSDGVRDAATAAFTP